jgi:hypothetical protein
MSGYKTYDNFTPQTSAYPTEKQKVKYNKALLQFENSRTRSKSVSTLILLANQDVVEAAKKLIDNNLIRGDANYRRYLTEKYLRLLINNGLYSYAENYWKGLYDQPYGEVKWYKVEFIIPVLNYLGEYQSSNDYGKYSQKVLSKYWVNGCSTLGINSRREQKTVLEGIYIQYCEGHPELSVKWFAEYVKNHPTERSQQVSMAIEIADSYFNAEQYAYSSGWYIAAINLSKEDKMSMDFDDFSKALDHLFLRKTPINIALKKAMASGVTKRRFEIDKCRKRLELIVDAGIRTIPLYELGDTETNED